MVGLKRCRLCGDAFAPDDEMEKCDACHIWCHRACQAERADQHCPRCGEDAWVTVVDF